LSIASDDVVTNEIRLPDDWEAREDAHGRVLYVNHASKTTAWRVPAVVDEAPIETSRHSTHMRALMERRYACSRRVSVADDEGAESSDWPALAFIGRPDVLSLIEADEAARTIYEQSTTVRHIVERVRKDPAKVRAVSGYCGG